MGWEEDEGCEFDVDDTKAVTDKAILVVIGDEDVWLPLSQIVDTDCENIGDAGYVVITSWIAKQKDLIS